MTPKRNRAKLAAPSQPGQGRRDPTLTMEQVRERVLAGLSEGRPLAEICRDEGMPNRGTIYDWKDSDVAFAQQIARARDDGWDAIANRCRETARRRGDSTLDVQRDKLIIDTDLKLLAKWDPQRYGDKLDITSGNEAFRAPPAAHFWSMRSRKPDEDEEG